MHRKNRGDWEPCPILTQSHSLEQEIHEHGDESFIIHKYFEHIHTNKIIKYKMYINKPCFIS